MSGWKFSRQGDLSSLMTLLLLFFEVIAKLIRNKFPKTIQELRDADLRKGISTCALQDKRILEKWTVLTAGTQSSEFASLVLLQMLILFYMQVRGFSFAKNINEQYKIINTCKQHGKKIKRCQNNTKKIWDYRQGVKSGQFMNKCAHPDSLTSYVGLILHIPPLWLLHLRAFEGTMRVHCDKILLCNSELQEMSWKLPSLSSYHLWCYFKAALCQDVLKNWAHI